MYTALMHRTQIYLEDSQYRLLKEKARRQGTSLAAVIRLILEEHLAAAMPHVSGDYMGEHWLASFALLAMLSDGAG